MYKGKTFERDSKGNHSWDYPFAKDDLGEDFALFCEFN